jgi:hypothetical protein
MANDERLAREVPEIDLVLGGLFEIIQKSYYFLEV